MSASDWNSVAGNWQYLADNTHMFYGRDSNSQPVQRNSPYACNGRPSHRGQGYYDCRCGWHGYPDSIQFARKHKLDVAGVLSSHAKSSPNQYICKVCIQRGDLENPKPIKAFGECLDSHRVGPDGVADIKNAYGQQHVVKTAPVASKREVLAALIFD